MAIDNYDKEKETYLQKLDETRLKEGHIAERSPVKEKLESIFFNKHENFVALNKQGKQHPHHYQKQTSKEVLETIQQGKLLLKKLPINLVRKNKNISLDTPRHIYVSLSYVLQSHIMYTINSKT